MKVACTGLRRIVVSSPSIAKRAPPLRVVSLSRQARHIRGQSRQLRRQDPFYGVPKLVPRHMRRPGVGVPKSSTPALRSASSMRRGPALGPCKRRRAICAFPSQNAILFGCRPAPWQGLSLSIRGAPARRLSVPHLRSCDPGHRSTYCWISCGARLWRRDYRRRLQHRMGGYHHRLRLRRFH